MPREPEVSWRANAAHTIKFESGGMAFGRNLMVLGGPNSGARHLRHREVRADARWPRARRPSLRRPGARITTTRDPDGRSRETSWNSFHVLYPLHRHRARIRGGRCRALRLWHAELGRCGEDERAPSAGLDRTVAYDPRTRRSPYLEPGPSSFALALSGNRRVLGALRVLGCAASQPGYRHDERGAPPTLCLTRSFRPCSCGAGHGRRGCIVGAAHGWSIWTKP